MNRRCNQAPKLSQPHRRFFAAQDAALGREYDDFARNFFHQNYLNILII